MRGVRYDDPVSLRRAGMGSALDDLGGDGYHQDHRHRRASGARPVRRRGSRRAGSTRAGPDDDGEADLKPGRRCPICGAALDGLRRDATYCAPACRIEASRRRRLEAGPVDGYPDLSAYLNRQRRTNLVADPPARADTGRLEAEAREAAARVRKRIGELRELREAA